MTAAALPSVPTAPTTAGAELRAVGVAIAGRRILDGVDLAVRAGELVALDRKSVV